MLHFLAGLALCIFIGERLVHYRVRGLRVVLVACVSIPLVLASAWIGYAVIQHRAEQQIGANSVQPCAGHPGTKLTDDEFIDHLGRPECSR